MTYQTVNQPNGSPTRKVWVTGLTTIAVVAANTFAPGIGELYPVAKPIIAEVLKWLPLMIPYAGYRAPEWASNVPNIPVYKPE